MTRLFKTNQIAGLRRHSRSFYEFSAKQNIVNATILGLGILLGVVLSLSSAAFAQPSGLHQAVVETAEPDPARQMTFDSAYNSLAAYVGESVAVSAWLTYIPDNPQTAVLRSKQAPQYQSLFAMNLQSFEQQTGGATPIAAAQFQDDALLVRVNRVPGRSRAWMVRACADGCQAQVSGPVMRTSEGRIVLDVRKVSPLGN